jgi:hypothetical protein
MVKKIIFHEKFLVRLFLKKPEKFLVRLFVKKSEKFLVRLFVKKSEKFLARLFLKKSEKFLARLFLKKPCLLNRAKIGLQQVWRFLKKNVIFCIGVHDIKIF